MLEKLKAEVYEANIALQKHGLVILTWGNVSGIDRESGLVVIKPSGVEYDKMSLDDMVVVDLNGNVADGSLKPSSDTPSHIALYKNFPNIGGITHTHSTWAVGCAQAGAPIVQMGTTHADYFYKSIPVTRDLTVEEINNDYEYNTGLCIVEAIKDLGASEIEMPGVLVKNHGPFTWGKNAAESVHNAVVLEEVAKMFVITKMINVSAPPMASALMDKHFLRKHGPGAYYGQRQ